MRPESHQRSPIGGPICGRTLTPPAAEALLAWMSEQGLGDGPIENVDKMTGGTQNVMLRFERSGRPYVFRRGPLHLRSMSNKVILRETRVLRALAGTEVPHPHLIAVCEDTSVLGNAVFYLMEPIDGFNAGDHLPAGSARPQPSGALQQCRLAIWWACWTLDNGAKGRHESSIVKALVSEELFKVADRCVQILGGIGISDETPVGAIFSDIRAFRIYDGPTEVHKYAIARQTLRNPS